MQEDWLRIRHSVVDCSALNMINFYAYELIMGE
jgi:hypothetical protein